MATNNKVVVKFLADTDAMRRGIQQTNKQLGAFGKAVKTLGVTLVATFGAREIAKFAGESLQAASDLEESINKVNAVFKQNADVVKDWADNSTTAFGLSKQAALEAAGTFGNLFTSFGVGVPEAEKMSVALTELSADLASFNNTSIDQALTALRSGLSGETEPLKRFGVALNQAAIEAKALELGLISNKSELDAAAKSQAVYALVLEQTTNAQGDFARTSEGLANTQRILQAAVEDAKASVGEGFRRALESTTEALGGSGGLAEAVENAGDKFGAFNIGVATAIEQLVEFRDKSRFVLGPLQSIGDFAYLVANRLSFGLVEGTAAVTKGFIASGEATLAWEKTIADADRQSRIAAQNIRGKFVPAALESKRAALEAKQANEQLARSFAEVIGAMGGRGVRQMDAFGREIDKQSIYWKNAKDENKAYWESLQDTTGSGGASSRLKDEADAVKEAADVIQAEFERVLEETQRQLDDWRAKVTSKLNIGTAFKEANDATAAYEAAKKRLEELRATPTDKRGDDFAQREAELVAEAERLGAEAGKGFLTRLAEQATDAETLSRNLANLDAAGLNEVLISQIASDANGAALSQAIVDGITADGYGVLDQLNRQASRIQNAGTALGETLVEPLPVEGAKGGEDFLFGLKGKGKEGNGLLPQIKADAPKVKKAIKNSLRTSVEVKVVYTPDTSRLEGAPGGRSVVRSVQEFERLNGRKWRDRVR